MVEEHIEQVLFVFPVDTLRLKAGMAVFLWFAFYRKRLNIRVCWHEVMDKVAMRRFFQVNGDIFFRTLCLVAVTTFFTSTGARQGDIVLAVNTLLMQLFTLFLPYEGLGLTYVL